MRKAKPFKAGDGLRHGAYAKSQPVEAVEALAKEEIRGLEEQIAGLRELERRLLERQENATSRKEAIDLGEAYSLAAFRMTELIKAERELAAGEVNDSWVEDVLKMLKAFSCSNGEELDESVMEEAMGGEAFMGEDFMSLTEEIASTRYVLRNVYRAAMESQDAPELIRLTGIYGSMSYRLAKMLKLENGEKNQTSIYLKRAIDQALEEVSREFVIPDELQ